MEELVKRVEAKCGWLYGQILAVGEVLMLVGEDIAQLVGQALGVAYPGIDVVCGAWAHHGIGHGDVTGCSAYHHIVV